MRSQRIPTATRASIWLARYEPDAGLSLEKVDRIRITNVSLRQPRAVRRHLRQELLQGGQLVG